MTPFPCIMSGGLVQLNDRIKGVFPARCAPLLASLPGVMNKHGR